MQQYLSYSGFFFFFFRQKSFNVLFLYILESVPYYRIKGFDDILERLIGVFVISGRWSDTFENLQSLLSHSIVKWFQSLRNLVTYIIIRCYICTRWKFANHQSSINLMRKRSPIWNTIFTTVLYYPLLAPGKMTVGVKFLKRIQ